VQPKNLHYATTIAIRFVVTASAVNDYYGLKINSGNKLVMLRACAEAAEVSSEASL
jgi:hypothetical protein